MLTKLARLYTQNRELSWLKFNERVLQEANDPKVPLLERLKFISIFMSNLDEFFMIRVGSLFDLQITDENVVDSRSGMTPQQQIDAIYTAVGPLYNKKDKIYNEIAKELELYGVADLKYSQLNQEEQKLVKQYFKKSILPVLSPQIIDSHHPFPHIHNNVLHIATILNHKGKETFGLIPKPASISDVYFLPGNETRYIRTENIIAKFADLAFDNYEVEEKAIIKLTRNADMNYNDEDFNVDNDFRIKIKKMLTKRKRLAPVRLEISNEMSAKLQDYLSKKLSLNKNQVFYTSSPMNLSFAFSLQSKITSAKVDKLIYADFTPKIAPEVNMNNTIMQQVSKKDLLLSFPYESINPFLTLIKEAANNPDVVSIKITIYRLASKAKLVEYLCAAAENGKDVTVIIELRARFDEQNNIDWSERLEEAGCNIIYGFEGYKVHSKICLITKKEKGEIKYITQVGTGNYNEKTAKLYTDLSLITADSNIGKDASEFFKNMAIGNLKGEYGHLLVAPISLKPTVIRLIDNEIAKGSNGNIFIKMNSLTDTDIIEKLKQASCAGVEINMIIRGICCIVPGVKGMTENIHISSIVGRYLEHSRIYAFGKGAEQKMYIASADFMTRNTQRRVEVACPIYDENVRKKIRDIMDYVLHDNVKARTLLNSGDYVMKSNNDNLIDSQQILMDNATNNENNNEVKTVKKRSLLQRFKNAVDAFKN